MIIKNKVKENTAIAKINVILIIAVLFLLSFYIYLANYAFSSEYRIGVIKRQIDKLSVDLSDIQRTLDESSDVISLRSFALQKGLIEARDAYVITKDSDFAIKDGRKSNNE